jgi:hypothetical protein
MEDFEFEKYLLQELVNNEVISTEEAVEIMRQIRINQSNEELSDVDSDIESA